MTEDADRLVTLDRFPSPHDAQLAAVHLQSEGLEVHVADVHTTTFLPFLTAFTGGVRLLVKASDLARAKDLLAAFDRGDFALPDDFDPTV